MGTIISIILGVIFFIVAIVNAQKIEDEMEKSSPVGKIVIALAIILIGVGIDSCR